jgi:hypothetical protein
MEGKKAFCIFKKEIGGPVRVQRDPSGLPRIFPTRELAEEEIAKSVVARIFEAFAPNTAQSPANTPSNSPAAPPAESLSVRDYVREVLLLEDGILQDPEGNQFQ